MEWRNYSWHPSCCPRAALQNTEPNFGFPHTGKAPTNPRECSRALEWSWAPSECPGRRFFTVGPPGSSKNGTRNLQTAWRRRFWSSRTQECSRDGKAPEHCPESLGCPLCWGFSTPEWRKNWETQGDLSTAHAAQNAWSLTNPHGYHKRQIKPKTNKQGSHDTFS